MEKSTIKTFLGKKENQIMILLFLILLAILFNNFMVPKQKWEYKVVEVFTQSHSRKGEEAMKYTSVTPSTIKINELGNNGWELIDSYLEVETSFPNFGKDGYVTGINSNVRPQRLVLIFKRPK